MPPLPTYANWAASFSPINLGPANQDFDKDGVQNIIEYAVGSDPTDGASNTTLAMGKEPAAGQFVLSFKRRLDDPSIGYTLLCSIDLSNPSWATIPNSSLFVNTSDGDFELIEYIVPTSPNNTFFRLKLNY